MNGKPGFSGGKGIAFAPWRSIIILLLFFQAVRLYPAAGALDADEQKWLSRGSRAEKEGWVYLHIEGSPYERGFQHGYLLAPEIEKAYAAERHWIYWQYPKDIDLFADVGKRLFDYSLDPELKAELKGMAAGLEKAGVQGIGYDQLLAHNALIEILWYWWPWAKQNLAARLPPDKPVGCSAFIATGSYTADSGVVMAHNTWVDYSLGGSFNVILDISPDEGNRMIMQTLAGYIHSGSDFFVCSSGLVGCETTIGDFSGGYDTTGTAEFCRVRRAMQYARTIDEWAEMLTKKNSGGYANAWLLGNVNTGEIARLELGTKQHKLEKKKDGYFVGSNIAEDHDLLLDETTSNISDIRKANVARRVSWLRLMKVNQGRIDCELAQQMLADHYDSYLGRDNPGPRSICGHNELADGISVPLAGKPPWWPSGALDGKVVDRRLAGRMSFWARWGSSCGTAFDAGAFLDAHPQYYWLRGFMDDRPSRNWTVFGESR